jgi:hypothetical protein
MLEISADLGLLKDRTDTLAYLENVKKRQAYLKTADYE